MEALSDQALRVLKLFGKTEPKHVFTTVGSEQEYFLIDKNFYMAAPTCSMQAAPSSAPSPKARNWKTSISASFPSACWRS